jgi:mannan endo-1,4-beta-mannosidase
MNISIFKGYSPFRIILIVILFISGTMRMSGQKPVTPGASPGAIRLLEYIYSISGKQTLSGQHCAPLVGSTRLSVAHRVNGHYPALFGQDFGFSYPGYWDGINYRQRIVDEAILRHEEGFIITIMWHAVPPNQDEPVSFSESIQSDLTDQEWNDLVTPGTLMNERWKSQVDVIAWFLKQLDYAEVPVLWRPYHEMNGGWFWWGQKKGPDGYIKLWQMMFDRFVNFHGLTNLVWVFNTNEFKDGVDPHETYYPGDAYVDILATDVYSEGFNKVNYDQMIKLAGDKPVALGEVGVPPDADKLKEQPGWTWFMKWGDPGGDRRGTDERALFESERVITHDELPWVDIKDPRLHYPVLK